MIELAPGRKRSLTLANPAMPAAGTFGFGGEYNHLVPVDRLGAVVTNPVTWAARKPASGPRVVPVPGGVLLHTGLPNPGVKRVIRRYGPAWAASPVPVIVHVVATGPDDVYRCCAALDPVEAVSGIELGLHDQVSEDEIFQTLEAAADATLLPCIVRLPLLRADELAGAAQEAGACAVTIGAPPRGTARDPATGTLVGGRLYGPWIKALALRAVGRVASRLRIPVIGCGGIHERQDARDFIEGARAAAVQVDSALWVTPGVLKDVANELGGLDPTRTVDSLSDEWYSDTGT
jgi:dihydroorotate dehydrogenase (NAD+) catalytic subunit